MKSKMLGEYFIPDRFSCMLPNRFKDCPTLKAIMETNCQHLIWHKSLTPDTWKKCWQKKHLRLSKQLSDQQAPQYPRTIIPFCGEQAVSLVNQCFIPYNTRKKGRKKKQTPKQNKKKQQQQKNMRIGYLGLLVSGQSNLRQRLMSPFAMSVEPFPPSLFLFPSMRCWF